MAISYFGNSVLIIIKNWFSQTTFTYVLARLLYTSQFLYNIKKTNINILNLTFIMRKKVIRITRFLRKTIADTFLETRAALISFSQGSFCFFKFFSSSISYRATCDLSFFSYGGYWR